MAKKGGTRHYKRIAIPAMLAAKDKKHYTWSANPRPGAHPKAKSITMLALLRDSLGVCTDLREAKKILNAEMVLVDGKAITDSRRAIGMMDVISIPKMNKAWRMQIINAKLKAKEISPKQAGVKFCKVTSKRTEKGGKIMITTHDGRTMKADNNVKVGSTLKMGLPEFKLVAMIEMKPGAKCLVTDGKHAGEFAELNKSIQRAGSKDTEAELKGGEGEFITLLKYLIVVDGEFEN